MARFVSLVAGLLLLFASSGASATCYEYSMYSYSVFSGWQSSKEALIPWYAGNFVGHNPGAQWTFEYWGGANLLDMHGHYYNYGSGPYADSNAVSRRVAASCGCVAPMVDTGSGCADPCASLAGTKESQERRPFLGGTAGDTSSIPGGMGDRFACVDHGISPYGCTVKIPVIMGYWDTAANGWVGLPSGPGSFTGVYCNLATNGDGSSAGTPSNEIKDPKTTCPDGQAEGSVNGNKVCYTPVTPVSSVPKPTATGTVTSTNPDGTTSTTSTTSSGTTVCTGGSCTTTTVTNTSVNGGTSTTSTSTSTMGRDAYCAANKGAKECMGDGSGGFSGTCETNFQCDGDATTCAIASAVNETYCVFVKDSDEKTMYEGDKVTAGGPNPGHMQQSTVAVDSSLFDQSSAIGTGSCIADKSITIATRFMSRTMTIEFSKICPYLEMLGNILVACSMLLAMRIVFRSD